MIRRALVTGATGMLGAYIVEQLVADGVSVRALVRDPRAAEWLKDLGADVVAGALEDKHSLLTAATACDTIFHAAAAIGSGGAWETYRRGNVDGTSNVVSAAAVNGTQVVHVSSTAVYGRARYRPEPTDETSPLPVLPEHDVYGRSKQEAESVVLTAHRDGRVRGTIVRPPVMYGRRDRQFISRIGPIFRRGVFPLIGGGHTTLPLAHAGSVAQGAILAARSDQAGGRVYLLANDHSVDTALLVECARIGLERKVYAPVVPPLVGRAGFGALHAALHLIGRSDLARHTHGTFEMLTRDNPFTSARARNELGWQPSVPPETALVEAFRSWSRQ